MFKAIAALAALASTGGAAIADIKVVKGVQVRDREAIDTNKDGNISAKEMQAHLDRMWAKKKS